MEARDRRFLDAVRALVYEHPASPYLPLLESAGCAYADLEQSVRERGLEETLDALREAGVHVTEDEWKGRAPIVRDGVELDVTPSDFKNPAVTGALVESTSSGSGGAAPRGTEVDRKALGEHAAVFRLTLDALGAATAPAAIWMPSPPGSGLANVLMYAKLGNTPEHWFSQTKPIGAFHKRVRVRLSALGARAVGVRLPRPEFTTLGQADRVAEWFGRGNAPRILMGFASSIIRAAQAARERNIDLAGRIVIVTGEPVTRERKEFLESLGLRVVAVYAATDANKFVGLPCLDPDAVDDYHLPAASLAVIPGDSGETGRVGLLLTSLTQVAGRVLLNTDIGDEAVIEQRECGCVYGRVGLQTHLLHVQSRTRRTSEGMTVPTHDLWEVAREELALVGGRRDDFQIWERLDEAGLSHLQLVVHPRLDIDPSLVVEHVLERLGSRSPGAKLAADVWRQAGTIELVREPPELSPRGKLLPVITVP